MNILHILLFFISFSLIAMGILQIDHTLRKRKLRSEKRIWILGYNAALKDVLIEIRINQREAEQSLKVSTKTKE